ncbi:MAG: hypothetical protein J2P46_11325, partial [Zavarzinella sp.]|nr:hypothetical protein [Zavarzinella sp.]
MHDPADIRLPRVAPLLLVAVLAGLAIARPGNLAGTTDVAYRLFTGLASVAVVGYVAWRFHGLIPAASAIVLLRWADPTAPPQAAFLERAGDTVLLVTLGIGIAAGSRQGRPGNLPWVLLALAASIPIYGWLCADSLPTNDPVARDRLRQVTIGLAVLSTTVGLRARSIPWGDRARLLGVVIGLPLAGIGAARLVHGHWPPLVEGGDWPGVVSEWQTAIREGSWSDGAWCWADRWIVGGLVVIGLWRTIARGWKEWKRGRPPLAWLIAAGGLGAMVALGARPLAPSSL